MEMLVDITQTRVLRVDGHNKLHPSSIFLVGQDGWCMEFDREEFVKLILTELFPVPALAA